MNQMLVSSAKRWRGSLYKSPCLRCQSIQFSGIHYVQILMKWSESPAKRCSHCQIPAFSLYIDKGRRTSRWSSPVSEQFGSQIQFVSEHKSEGVSLDIWLGVVWCTDVAWTRGMVPFWGLYTMMNHVINCRGNLHVMQPWSGQCGLALGKILYCPLVSDSIVTHHTYVGNCYPKDCC